MLKLVLGSVCAWWRGELREGGGVRGGGGTYEVHASPPRLKEVQDALGMGYKDAREVNARGGGAAVGNRQCSMQGRGENNNSSAAALLRHAHPACTGVPCPSPPRSPPSRPLPPRSRLVESCALRSEATEKG